MQRIWQRLIPALLLAMATGIAVSAAAPQAVIEDVRLGKHGDHTRFVLDMSDMVDVDVFTLADPYRIVVDFPEVGWRLDPATAQGPVGLVKGFRFGLFRPGRSRLVIDLSGPGAVVNKFLLPPRVSGTIAWSSTLRPRTGPRTWRRRVGRPKPRRPRKMSPPSMPVPSGRPPSASS